MFNISKYRDLTREDMILLPPPAHGRIALANFMKILNPDRKNKKGESKPTSLWWTLIIFQWKNLLLSLIFKILSDIIMVTMPLVFRNYSKQVRNPKASNTDIILSFLLIPILTLVQDLLRQHSAFRSTVVGAVTGQALRCYLYEKLISAPYSFLSIAEPSMLTRLIFFEIDNLLTGFGVFSSLISGPIVTLVSSLFLIYFIGKTNWILFSTIIILQAIAILAILNELNKLVTRARYHYAQTQSKQALKLQELITQINQIRSNQYEDQFDSKLKEFRSQSINKLMSVHRFRGMIEILFSLTPYIVSCLIVLIFNLASDDQFQAQETFAIIAMMIASTVPLRAFSFSLRKARISYTAFLCIDAFFTHVKKHDLYQFDWEDVSKQSGQLSMTDCFFSSDKGYCVARIQGIYNSVSSTGRKNALKKLPGVTIIKGSKGSKTKIMPLEKTNLTLDETDSQTVLRNLNFSIKPCEKICVVCKEEQLRKAFFLAILGELSLEQGNYFKLGKVALLDMENPRFLRSTIRDNITMGETYSRFKLTRICKEVGLNLDIYPGRDLTEIVEGQRNITSEDKRRILLARLLYLDPEIVMINKYFDKESKDQQKPMYDKIVKGLLKDRTVLYASNVNLVVKQSERVLVLKDGEIVEDGTYAHYISQRKSVLYEVMMSDISGSSNFFGKILEGVRITKVKGATNSPRKLISQAKPILEALSGELESSKLHISGIKRSAQHIDSSYNSKMDKVLSYWVEKTVDMNRGKMLREEEEFVLENRFESLYTLLFARGKLYPIISFLFFVLTAIALVSLQLYFSLWATLLKKNDYQDMMYILVGIVLIVAMIVILRESIYRNLIIGNLKVLSMKAITSILKAKPEWFNQNSSSRIVYLLTRDQSIVDHDFVRSFFVCSDAFLTYTVLILVFNWCFLGPMAIVTCIVFYFSRKISKRYDRVSQKLIAFTTKSRAELMDIYLETFENMPMLRAKSRPNYLSDEFYSKTNEFQRAVANLHNFSMRWLMIRISALALIQLIMVASLPFINRLLGGKMFFKNMGWEIGFSLGALPLFQASIVNFSRFYPITMLNLLSAQRIFRYIFDLTKNPSKNSLNIEYKPFLKRDKNVLKNLAIKLEQNKNVSVILPLDHFLTFRIQQYLSEIPLYRRNRCSSNQRTLYLTLTHPPKHLPSIVQGEE